MISCKFAIKKILRKHTVLSTFVLLMAYAQISGAQDWTLDHLRHSALSPDWTALLSDLSVSESVYREHVDYMSKRSRYPKVEKARIPVFLPAKTGIRYEISKNEIEPENKQKEPIHWEFCVEDRLPEIIPINTQTGQGSHYFAYYSIGNIRADSKLDNGDIRKVEFQFMMLGSAIVKHPVKNQNDNSDITISDLPGGYTNSQINLGGKDGPGYLLSFNRRNIAYGLLITKLMCDGKSDCGDLDQQFFDDLFVTLRMVGGLPATGTEIAGIKDYFNKQSEGYEQHNQTIDAGEYTPPGDIFSRQRPAIDTTYVYEHDFTRPIFNYEPPNYAHFAKDHRELKSLIGDSAKVDEFFTSYPWRDSFCLRGEIDNGRCMADADEHWQDVFPTRCQQVQSSDYRFPDPAVVELPQFARYRVGISPELSVQIMRRNAVQVSASKECDFVQLSSVAFSTITNGFQITPSYSSLVHGMQ